jgi:hypothetical protein
MKDKGAFGYSRTPLPDGDYLVKYVKHIFDDDHSFDDHGTKIGKVTVFFSVVGGEFDGMVLRSIYNIIIDDDQWRVGKRHKLTQHYKKLFPASTIPDLTRFADGRFIATVMESSPNGCWPSANESFITNLERRLS